MRSPGWSGFCGEWARAPADDLLAPDAGALDVQVVVNDSAVKGFRYEPALAGGAHVRSVDVAPHMVCEYLARSTIRRRSPEARIDTITTG
ncbi:hypothetical protein [Catellatospora sp. NPDC049609]|uniref:hypothetical protein n=1 Tax=Catellatospora sp. NPDC049609 TaxID=3155505 RepID=UPI00343098D3